MVNLLAEFGPHVVAVAVTDGFNQQFFETLALEHFAKNVEHPAFQRLAFDAEFFEQAKINVAFAGFLGDEIPQMANLLLADTVDAPEPLFKAVGIPRQIVVHHQICTLQIDAFTGGVGGNQHADFGVGTEKRLRFQAFVAMRAAVNVTMAS